MCVSCVSTTELWAANAGLAVAAARPVLQRLGLIDRHDPLTSHRRAVAFLRSLDLDPVESLGAAVVAAADASEAHERRPVYATGDLGRSMRSHAQLAVQ